MHGESGAGAGLLLFGLKRASGQFFCAGRWLHPLNLFGLILVWKRLGERCLEEWPGLDRDSAWRLE